MSTTNNLPVNRQKLSTEDRRAARYMEFNKDMFALLDALRAPVITFSALWKDVLPDRFIKLVTTERLIYVMTGRQYAGDVEVALYIYTRTLEAPMDRDWADIYTHISCKVCQDHFNEDHWEQIRAPRSLNEYQEKYLLMPLRIWIYKKRRDAMKQWKRKESVDGKINHKERKETVSFFEDCYDF